jgi:hypothetical protein
MSKLSYGPRLLSEFWKFAWQKKAYWVLPLILILVFAGLLIFGSQGSLPFIYALF